MKHSWVPHPRQRAALIADVSELLYGGARGGGKTDAGLVWLIEPKYIRNPDYRALVIRRNSSDLSDWLDRAKKMYRPLSAQVVGNPAEIRFPSGAVIRTGHLKDATAYEKYQGHEYQKILIEELTKIPREDDYEKLIASARSTIPGVPARVMATTNPDGPGSAWVKKRWQCDTSAGRVRTKVDPNNPKAKRTMLFVPATVEDNPTLIENDPNYVAMLNSIQDDLLRRQWRDGSWENPEVQGSFYTKYINQMYDWYQPPHINTSQPAPPELPPRIFNFEINMEVPVDTWWDIGVHDKTAIWFSQTIGDNHFVVDYYENNNEGIEHYAKILTDKKYKYREHFAPHDINVTEWGTNATRLETARKYGISFRQIPKLRIEDGIEASRKMFRHTIFHLNNTEDGVYLLRNYRREFDEKRQIFRDKPIHDYTSHAADAFRYMSLGYFKYRKTKAYVPPSKSTSTGYKTRRS